MNLIELLVFTLSELFSMLCTPIFAIPIIINIAVFIIRSKQYANSTYYKVTKLPYYSVRWNIGRYGEYLTYKKLKEFENEGAKFLFNVYVPKENGETSEIDVLMISSKGVFVFESKNYSGWIFGDENKKNWYQTLPRGSGRSRKEHFYNPIMQNRSHIKHLKVFLVDNVPMQSIIVFSERCTLKNIQMTSKDISVINRYDVKNVIKNYYNKIPEILLEESEIKNIYDKLYPYTQVDNDSKIQHIDNINKKLKNDSKKFETDNNIINTERNSVEQQESRCPKCGGELVLRVASKGNNAGKQFYGCANFPKCKYIKDVN